MKKMLPLLLIALLTSSMALVYVRYESRLSFIALHALDTEKDNLNVEYGRLLLERATWSIQHSVMREAQDRLSMQFPNPDAVVTLVVPSGGVK